MVRFVPEVIPTMLNTTKAIPGITTSSVNDETADHINERRISSAYSIGKIWGTSALALAILGLIGYLCWTADGEPQPRLLNVAIAVFGVCVGWLVGAVVSPYDDKEKTEFSAYIKLISTFLSGYALSKADQFFPNSAALTDSLLVIRILIFVSSFLAMMLITFYFRRYAFSATGPDGPTTAQRKPEKQSQKPPNTGGLSQPSEASVQKPPAQARPRTG
jgi:hypothetical protein